MTGRRLVSPRAAFSFEPHRLTKRTTSTELRVLHSHPPTTRSLGVRGNRRATNERRRPQLSSGLWFRWFSASSAARPRKVPTPPHPLPAAAAGGPCLGVVDAQALSGAGGGRNVVASARRSHANHAGSHSPPWAHRRLSCLSAHLSSALVRKRPRLRPRPQDATPPFAGPRERFAAACWPSGLKMAQMVTPSPALLGLEGLGVFGLGGETLV